MSNKRTHVICFSAKTIYLSSSDGDVHLSMDWLRIFEKKYMYKCLHRQRDGDVGILRHENARHLIPKCQMVVAIVTKAFIDDDWCLYEVALAMDFGRDVLLLTYHGVPIPKLFETLKQIRGNIPCAEKEAISQIQRYLETDSRPATVRYDLLKEFLWSIERKLLSDVQASMALQTTQLMGEITHLQRRIQELIQLRLQESSDLLESNHRLKAELMRKMDGMCSENHFPFSYVKELTKEHIEQKLAIEQLQIQNATLQRKLEETITSRTRSCKPLSEAVYTTEVTDVLYRIIPELCNQRSGYFHEKDSVRLPRVPSEIRAFCERYQELLGLTEIETLGRHLGLPCDCLDRINYYKQYGPTETFWQLIREYIAVKNGNVSVASLIDSLAHIGINLEGKPMQMEHQIVLDNSVPHIYENIQDTIIILPAMMKDGYMSTAKAGYILNSATKLQSLLRFIEFLKTKEDGLHILCKALQSTGQNDLARTLRYNFSSVLREASRQGRPSEGEDKQKCIFV